jgi:hypothetical protein
MKKSSLLLYILCAMATKAFAQQVTTTFGKNRVQFNQDFKEWLQYESPNFVGYWYGNARNVGQAAIQFAEYDNQEIQNILEHRISDKIEIIAYTDLTDIKQSNIGEGDLFAINGSESWMGQLDKATGHRMNPTVGSLPMTNNKVIGNKIFVYFDGDHQHLRRQIREGIATIYLNSMLYGSNLQEVVQNAISYSLPDWYKEGILAYTANPWDAHLDNLLKDMVLAPKFEGFARFSKKNPQLAGHAFWYFISQTYGKQTLSNLLYLTRINRNTESGFQYILGGNSAKIYDAWYSFFKERYSNDMLGKDDFKGEITTKYKGKIPLQSLKLSTDGKTVAYVMNEVGRSKVFLQDLKTGKRQLIVKTGFYNNSQTTDYDYPIITWKPNGYELSVLYERRDRIHLYTYDTKLKKSTNELMLEEFQRIYSAEYLSNSDLALSASTNGFSDIFIYRTIGRTFERITNDFYDDLDVSVCQLKGQKGLLWASNRPDSLLSSNKIDSIFPLGNFDIFYFNTEKRTKNPIQVSYSPNVNERNPIGIDSTYFAYLSEGNGIYNRDVAYLDTVFDHYRTTILYKDAGRKVLEKEFTPSLKDSTFIDTFWKTPVFRTVAYAHHHSNYTRNILQQHIASNGGKLAELVFDQKKFKVFVHAFDPKISVTPLMSVYRQLQLLRQKPNKKADNYGNNIVPALRDSIKAMAVKVDTSADKRFDDYFQSPFPNSNASYKKESVPTPIVTNTSDNKFLKNKIILTDNQEVIHDLHQFKGTRVIPYRLKFRNDAASLLKFDNRPLVNMAEIFTGGFSTQPLGLLSYMSFKDLLEDHKLEIGARFSLFIGGRFNAFNNASSTIVNNPANPLNQQNTNYNSREFYVTYWDKKKKIDKKYTYYHRVNKYTDSYFTDVSKSDLVSDIAEIEYRLPLDIYSSFRVTPTVRLDKLVYLSTDSATLYAPARNEQRLGLKAEYVFDNALQIGTNLWSGTRMKVYSEMMKGLRIQLSGEQAFDLKKGFLGVVGFDARHYQRIDRRSIIALRLTAATSFGAEKMLYVLGGVEGMLRSPSSNNLSLPAGNFAFVMPVQQMRGFGQNIRNGTSVALFNAELRIPITQYILPNARANWLKNLQIVPFFDAGTAWHGSNLFSSDNPLNTVYLPDNPNSPIKLKVNYFRDPIVAGYGVGVRTMLMGYYIKFDYAYGIETRTIQKPLKYISLGTDF